MNQLLNISAYGLYYVKISFHGFRQHLGVSIPNPNVPIFIYKYINFFLINHTNEVSDFTEIIGIDILKETRISMIYYCDIGNFKDFIEP